MDIGEMERIESEIRTALRDVRLIFELGFPSDLVSKADSVVHEVMKQRRLFNTSKSARSKVNYPASFILHVANHTKNRTSRELWTSDELSHLLGSGGVGSAGNLAESVSYSFQTLQLETFEDLIEVEGALRNVTPLTMHSGLPINNIGALLHLIDNAMRRNRFVADEQIKYWTSTSNGFNGLWVAPRRLLQESGSIGRELLERINDFIAHPEDPRDSGLPDYLINAIETETARAPIVRAKTRTQVPRPRLLLDPYSCRGPILKLPITNDSIVRWRASGTPKAEYATSSTSTREVDLAPNATYEISAIGTGNTILESRSFQAFNVVPIYFFDPKNGHLLEPDRSRIDLASRSVIALVHPRANIEGGQLLRSEFPDPVGSWSNWRVEEYDVSKLSQLKLRDNSKPDAQETISFRRGLSRPSLSEPSNSARRLRHFDFPVFDSAPLLHIDLGSVDASLVNLRVASINKEENFSLKGVPIESDCLDLNPYLGSDGVHTVEVIGPSGLSMRPQTFLLLRDLNIAQSPKLAIPEDDISVVLTSGSISSIPKDMPDKYSKSVVIDHGGYELVVALDRLNWSLRLEGEDATSPADRKFRLAIDELSRAGAAFIYLDSGLPQRLRLGLRTEAGPIRTIESKVETSRWTLDLGVFLDDVRLAGAEECQIIVTIDDGREVVIGSINAQYIVDLDAIEVDPDIAPAVIRLRLNENGSFKSRVVRVWNLSRPWEESFSIQIPDGVFGEADVVMPAGHKHGIYRLLVRVEGPLTVSPRMPIKGTRGVCDVAISSGAIFDTTDPIDRLVLAVMHGKFEIVRDNDVATAGYVLIALLAQVIRDNGGRGLTSAQAGTILSLLFDCPQSIVSQVAQAITLNVLASDERLPVAISLLSIVFEAEDKHDLKISPDEASLIWSQLPWLGSAVEPWHESKEASFQWTKHLGWPIQQVKSDSDEHGDLDEEIDLATSTSREILTTNFDVQARLFRGKTPDVIEIIAGAFRGTRTDLPLSRDAEWDAVIRNIPLLTTVEIASEIERWRHDHMTAVNLALGNLGRHPHAALLTQYAVRAMSPYSATDQWFFHNVVALAVDLTEKRSKIESTIALVDACAISQQWVGFAILLAISQHSH